MAFKTSYQLTLLVNEILSNRLVKVLLDAMVNYLEIQ